MTDHAELRRLAEQASSGNWYGEDSQVLIGKHAVAYCNHKVDAQFIGKATPKTVLALLDEIDRLKAENDAFRSALKPFADYCTATDGKGIRLAIGGSCGDTEIDRTEWKAAQAALEGATK
ncbi:TPA: ead/Ea22-like family protein [Pseudomonas aeruginosa]|nr:ead/Ea22-like family protein [Pseudomonas aeruginosa]